MLKLLSFMENLMNFQLQGCENPIHKIFVYSRSLFMASIGKQYLEQKIQHFSHKILFHINFWPM